MIPVFPDFKKLAISDKADIEKITKDFEPYSDFNFTSLFSWDTNEEIQISRLYENLVVLFTDYITNERFFSFIGSTSVDLTISALIAHAKHQKIDPIIRLVPEAVIKLIDNSEGYRVDEDRDGFDYILSVKDLVELKGKGYHPKKNFITRYEKQYGALSTTKLLDLSLESTEKQVTDLFYRWEKSRGKSRDETQNELTAIERILNNANLLDVQAIGIFIEDKLQGFAINEIVSDEYGIAHYEKADLSYVGIFQYVKHQSALFFMQNSVKYMNIEQDLGIEGLRKAKEALYPIKFLKKYTVELR